MLVAGFMGTRAGLEFDHDKSHQMRNARCEMRPALNVPNIPKEIRRKPSNCAYVLLAYLPTTRLENVSNKAARRRQLANLYHACMGRVLEPLKSAGVSGIFMATGDGSVHRNHPLLACFSGDYPE